MRLIQNKIFLISILILITISLYLFLFFNFSRNLSCKETRYRFEQVFSHQQKLLEEFSYRIIKHPEILSFSTDYISDTLDKSNPSLVFFLFRNDSLIYWTNNSVNPSDYNLPENETVILKLPNAYYQAISLKNGPYRLIGLNLIRYLYPYNNSHLINYFNPAYDLSPGIILVHMPDSIQQSPYVFKSITPEETSKYDFSSSSIRIFFLLFLLIFSLLIILIYQIYQKIPLSRNFPTLTTALLIIDILLLRILIYYIRFPSHLFESDYFTPFYYGYTLFFNSIGDLVLNSITIFAVSVSVYSRFSIILKSGKGTYSIFTSFSIFLHFFIFFKLIHVLVQSLILDSNFSMDLTNVVSLNFPAYLSIISFVLILISYALISYKLFDKLYCLFISNSFRFFLSFFSAATIFLIFNFLRSQNYELTIIPIIFIFLLLFIKKYLNTYYSFLSVTILVIFFSAVSSFLLRKATIEKDSQYRSILTLQLSRTSDPVTEYTFQVFEDNITKDSVILNNLAQYNTSNQHTINNHLKYNYFDKIFPGYNVFITICNQGNVLNIQPDNYLILCEDYFLSQILNFCDTTPSEYLFRYNISNTYSYLVKLPYSLKINDSISKYTIYAEAYYNSYPDEGLGYPELLVEEGNISYPDLTDYSYARYYKGDLFYKFGNAPYRHKINPMSPYNPSFIRDGYIHYYYELADQNVILLSKEKLTFLDKISPFSFLFLTISIIVLLFITFFNIIPSGTFNGINLRNRFQVMIIILLVFVFLFIGAISITFIFRFNNDKNHDILEEKTFSVLTELEHKLSSEPILTDSLSDYLSTLLTKFSQVFFSDINLYDLSGNLLATSRPGIFSKGLTSELMNPKAYRAIFYDNKILHIQQECIGHYNYLSAYIPFRNSNNEISAILNLPYFARQTELRSEISSFLSTYINIYILFIILSMLISLLVSRYVTRPLQLLKTKLAQLSLKSENEKIIWSAKDEIGTLVAEYNRMVDELEKNALLLAQSERENAWREMARQVAHEIKNPLTPMKLSVQALLKSWNDKSPDFPERLKRFTNTISEQIDSLSYIAEQFSNLYNLPEPKNEEFNLSSVLLQTADLFRDSSIQNASIVCNVESNCYFTGDKKLFARVFTNLIQNSVQALSDKQDGQITIRLHSTSTSIIIQISDNGPGISSDISHKIFQPNFTTKSGGMGLGLAMVKSIIDYYNGNISFKSEPDKGTMFTVELPTKQIIF